MSFMKQHIGTNEIQRFIFNHFGINGYLISMNTVWKELIEKRDYSPIAKKILGGLTLFSVLFAEKMKRDVSLNFQLKAVSPVEFVRVEAVKEISKEENKANSLFVRGMARKENVDYFGNEIITNKNNNKNRNNSNDFIADQNSYLLMNLRLPETKIPYQSFVPLVIKNKKLDLEKTLLDFLHLSEQQQSFLKIFVYDDFIGGIFLQKMPKSNFKEYIDEDAFNRLCNFANTLKADELRKLNNTDILYKLFNEDAPYLDVFVSENIYCKNKDEYDFDKFTDIMKAFGKENAYKLLNEHPERKVIIYDEMSAQQFELNEEDLNIIFEVDDE